VAVANPGKFPLFIRCVVLDTQASDKQYVLWKNSVYLQEYKKDAFIYSTDPLTNRIHRLLAKGFSFLSELSHWH